MFTFKLRSRAPGELNLQRALIFIFLASVHVTTEFKCLKEVLFLFLYLSPELPRITWTIECLVNSSKETTPIRLFSFMYRNLPFLDLVNSIIASLLIWYCKNRLYKASNKN